MEADGWFALNEVLELRVTKRWCQVNGVEFFDHRIENYPEELRGLLLRARAAARGKRKWVLRWDDVSRTVRTRYSPPFPLGLALRTSTGKQLSSALFTILLSPSPNLQETRR